jgi:hypothetical protein
VARRVIAANEAGVAIATNSSLLAVAVAHFDLQLAAGRLAIAREAAGNAALLANITGTYARSGAGLVADYRRILAASLFWELRGLGFSDRGVYRVAAPYSGHRAHAGSDPGRQ